MKAIPGIGTILGIGSQVVLSGITTYAVGHIFNDHFSNHQPLKDFNLNNVKDLFDDLLKKGKDFVDDLQKKSESSQKDIKKETAIIIKKMTENGIIKEKDSQKILNELEKE